MSIKQMIDEYLTEWEDKCNVKRGAVHFGDLTFKDYCHTTDTIEVGISIKENWLTILYATAHLRSEWVSEHLDELNDLRTKLYEATINAKPNERYEAAKNVLSAKWRIINIDEYSDTLPF